MANINRISLPSGSAYDLQTPAILYGEVDSTSTSTAFTATVPGITELYDGVCVYLKNGVVTSASGWTLDINNLGAKPVYQNLAAASRSTTIFNVAYTMMFIYNSTRVSGGCWDIFYGYNSNDNTIGYYIRANQNLYRPAKVLYRYQILFTTADGTLLPANTTSNSTGTSKTLSTESFDPWGDIYYYNTTTTVQTTTAIGASYLWSQYSVDLRYAFNAGSTLTIHGPVYVKCIPQSDGLVKFSGNDCIVQALPSTEDGYVYIYLGQAYTASNIVLLNNHHVYYYANGAIRLWNNPRDILNVDIYKYYEDDDDDEGEYRASSSYSEIFNHIKGGGYVNCILDALYPCSLIGIGPEGLYFEEISIDAIGRTKVILHMDNSIEVNTYSATIPKASNSSPIMDGTASAGTSADYSRKDHVHPTDTSRAPLASPAFTGTPTAPTASSGTNTTQIATTEFVNSAVSSALTTVMTYKGTKATVSALPASGNKAGDVWHVTEDGGEYAWDGSAWQELGTAIDTSAFVTDVQDSSGNSLVSNGVATVPDGFNVSVVQSLPTTNIDEHTVYLVLKAATVGSSTVGNSTVGGENDTYDEYIYVNNAWEKLGDDLDPDAFARPEDIPTKVSDLTDDIGIVTEWTQSDWEASSSDSAAYILNKPAIRADYGENSIVENDVNADSPTEYIMNFTGEAGAITYTWPRTGTIPSSPKLVLYNNDYYLIKEWNSSSGTCTLNKTLSADTALSSTPVKVYGTHAKAIGKYSNVEGGKNIAYGDYSHAEGRYTIAAGITAHAEGTTTKASGSGSHAEGVSTETSGTGAHSEGTNTSAFANYSHAEGRYTIANHSAQHVFGEYNIEDPSTAASNARGNYVEIVGNGTATNSRSNARTLDWSGNEILAGKLTVGAGPTNNMDVATKQYVDSATSSIPTKTSDLTNDSGFITSETQSDWEETSSSDSAYILNKPAIRVGDGENSIVEGMIADDSFSNIYTLTISGDAKATVFSYSTQDTLPSYNDLITYGVAIYNTTCTPIKSYDSSNSTIELYRYLSTSAITNGTLKIYYKSKNISIGKYSHTEGESNTATGIGAHAEGRYSAANESGAHAEGYRGFASGVGAHAEGSVTRATETGSHAEGNFTTASNSQAHAEGYYTTASGKQAHVEGCYTIAQRKSQHVFGEYNIADTTGTNETKKGSYIEIVGNGTADNARSNARTLDWSGNEVLAGKLTVGVDPTANMDVATKQYVDSLSLALSGNTIQLKLGNTVLSSITLPVYSGGVTGVTGGTS